MRDGEEPKAITLHIISRYDMCGHCLNIAESQLIRQLREIVTDRSIPVNIVYYGNGPIGTSYISPPPFSSRIVGRPIDKEIQLERDLTVMHVEL